MGGEGKPGAEVEVGAGVEAELDADGAGGAEAVGGVEGDDRGLHGVELVGDDGEWCRGRSGMALGGRGVRSRQGV